MTSVKVAVRVRPFNDREKESNSTTIIRMEGDDTYIKNPVSFNQTPNKLLTIILIGNWRGEKVWLRSQLLES